MKKSIGIGVVCLVCLVFVPQVVVAGTARLSGEPAEGNPWAALHGTIVSDPSFEAGSPNPVWDEFSSNFGTPLCTVAGCGTGGGTGPNTGSWWAWFGGIAALETGSVSQLVTIPAGDSATLTFALEMPACSGDPADFMEVTVGGIQVFEVRGNDPMCGAIGYAQQTIDISSFTDQTVELEFFSTIQGSDVTNFFVDDVDITVGGGGGFMFSVTGNCPGTTTLTASGGTPNGNAGIIFSTSEGNDVLGGGPCAGTQTGLTNPKLFTIVPLDGAGGFSIMRTAPAGVCGRFLQLVDAAAGCTLSNVTQVPN